MAKRGEDEPLKSALEVAMERLREKDRLEGSDAPRALNDEQKKAITEVRVRYEARIAETKILQADSIRKAVERGDAEAHAQLEEDHVRELAGLGLKRDEEIEAIREGR